MHKLIKILGNIISAAIMLLIILPVFVSLMLNIPLIQNFIIHKATTFISQKLETTISIDHIDIGLFNRVKIDGLYVEDYQRDTLLYAKNISAFISDFGLSGNGLVIRDAHIYNTKFCLNEAPSGDMNIKQIIDKLSDPNKPKDETPTSFKLTIVSAVGNGVEFQLNKFKPKAPSGGMEYDRLQVKNIKIKANELVIMGGNITADIESLSGNERCGLGIEQLKCKFKLGDGYLGFKQMYIRTQRSELDIPTAILDGGSWDRFSDFLSTVRITADVRPSTLSSADLAYFVTPILGSNLTARNISLTANGTVDNFTTDIASIEVGAHTFANLTAKVKGLPDIRKTHFDLKINRLTSMAKEIDLIIAQMSGKTLPSSTMKIIANAGKIDLRAKFMGTLGIFRTQAALTTSVGKADCNLLITPALHGLRKVDGGVSAQNIRLGELLGNPKFGSVSVAARIDGEGDRKSADANVRGEVTNFQFNNYTYDSLHFDGHIKNRQFDGRISANDPCLDFDFSGMIDVNDSIPRYDFSLDLRKANLARLGINPRDSISELTLRMVARAAGRTFDDLNGNIRVMDASYLYNDKQIKTKQLTIRGDNTEQNKLVEFRSDFADVTFRSKTSYKKVIEYLKMSAWKYLPILYDKEKYIDHAFVDETAIVDDYSLLSVQLKNINPIMDALTKGVQIADGSQLQLLFNPASDKLSLKASSEFIEQGDNMLVTNINVNASNHGDSLAFFSSSDDFYMGGLHLRNLSVMGGAREGRLRLTTGFNDSLRRTSGLLGITASMSETAGANGREMTIRILPSHLTQGDKSWQIFAQRIVMDTARVAIENFYVMNAQQDLLINGIASRNRTDSVTMRLRNFDLAPFSQMIEQSGYSLKGVTNGSATIKSAFKESEITANILMDSVSMNGVAAPPLLLLSKWDFQRNRAGFLIQDRVKNDTLIQGFYVPDKVRYYAKMKLDSLDMGLLNPILKGVISQTQGVGRADIVVTGERDKMEMHGSVCATGFETLVDFTQVRYKVPEVVLNIKNNHLITKGVTIYDPEGNKGLVDFDLSLQHFSNIAYNLRVAPQEMLVLNTRPQDNNLFHGRVYATGVATIDGDKRGVNMNVTATTDGKSNFNLSLTGKSNLAMANFVKFESARKADSLNYLAQRKQLFERRQTDKKSTESSMNINLALNVQPNLDFKMEPMQGNVIEARGVGLLNLEINPGLGLFDIYGDYTISEGYYNLSLENIITRKFNIQSGSSMIWTGSPMDALLDISAVYKLKASIAPLTGATDGNERSIPVDCIINLSERLTNPAIKFDVRVPQADADIQSVIANSLTPETISTQFAYLLIANSFMSETSGVSNNIGSSMSAAVGIQFLTNQLSKWLSLDDYNILINYRPQTNLTNEELDFGISKSLINNRLLVEVEGNYIIDNKLSANKGNISNLMGEAYITWLIDRAGNLKLRGFTQTIDRYDENQGLQETGIGVYYKEDFNNLKDLRERVKSRFTNKKRKANRVAKREAKREAIRVADSIRQVQAETTIKITNN